MKRKFRIIVMLSLASLTSPNISSGQQPSPYRLTLREAVQQALEHNVNVLVAYTQVEEGEGTSRRLKSLALFPHVQGQIYSSLQRLSIDEFGLTGLATVALPEVTGPYSNYDVHFAAEQNIIDLHSYREWKASQRAVEAGKLDYEGEVDLVILAAADLYLKGQSTAARIDAAQSRVTDSSTLFKLAKDKHDAGTATGVDVLRAQVQLANDKQALLVAQNQYKQSLLALARYLGMNPGAPLELADPLRYRPLPELQPESLVPAALLARPDYLALASQRQAVVDQQRANRARYYPKFSIFGGYGELGRNFGGFNSVGIIQGQIDFTLFERDVSGEAQEIASRLKRVDYQIADLRRGIEEDVREALLNIQSAAEQVAVAKEGQDLAQRELELAQDRFQSGTTNNVEVITAQDQLARAQENYILAVSSHTDATFGLAAALADVKSIGQ
ncbi:MAG TPA: TolC family protein [Candidatus Aquilonibacter sp.]|nr:TolC family protein [Candidatus Aquilonibacter sp.]